MGSAVDANGKEEEGEWREEEVREREMKRVEKILKVPDNADHSICLSSKQRTREKRSIIHNDFSPPRSASSYPQRHFAGCGSLQVRGSQAAKSARRFSKGTSPFSRLFWSQSCNSD